MTHEFKTPISTINISSDVILDPEIINNPERLFNYGNLIKQENNRLNEQVEKVLNIAKVERKYFNLNKELIDLHNLINSIIQGIEVSNNHKNIKTIISLKAEKFKISADKLHLTNILYSIMDNAVKYSTDNPVITFSTENDTKKLRLKISDNGPGIEKEYHKKIFDKFFRIPTGNVHDVKGFGLGLYYVKYICFIHKWKIHLESKLNEGSCFEIIMPLS